MIIIESMSSSLTPSLLHPVGVVVDTSIQSTDKLSRMRKLEMALDNVVAPLGTHICNIIVPNM